MAKDPPGPQIGGKLIGAVVAVEAGRIEDARHRAGARSGDHVDDDAVLFEHLEDAEVRHAASTPAAESHADSNAAEVVDQSLQAARKGPTPGQLRWHHGDLEIAAGHVAEVWYDRSHRDDAVQKPGDAGLVAPAARRHVQGVETADRGVARGGRHEENRTIGDLHQAHDLVRVEVRWDVEDDARRVLPLGHLLADLFGFQNPAIDAEGPESHSRPPLPRIGIAEHGKILAHFAQAIEESFRRPTGGG